jgi:hypothetical protein
MWIENLNINYFESVDILDQRIRGVQRYGRGVEVSAECLKSFHV